MTKRINYIAIALTTKCNYQCFYCKKTGESINSAEHGTWKFEDLKKVLKIAYENKLTTFRLTGGEPTMVDYLSDLIEFIMELGQDTKIRLNTNGYNIEKYYDILEKYRNRILDVVISIDSTKPKINGESFYKYLSPKIEEITRELVKRKIKVRYNVVVTVFNKSNVIELIHKAIELGANVKILDLIIRDEYIGSVNSKINAFENKKDYGISLYSSLKDIKQYLERTADNSKDNYSIANSNGIPMSGYFFGENWVQVKDSSQGALYASECESCDYRDSCLEGVFSPMLSVGNVLNIAGCMNKDFYFSLKGKSESEIRACFSDILKMFEHTKLNKR